MLEINHPPLMPLVLHVLFAIAYCHSCYLQHNNVLIWIQKGYVANMNKHRLYSYYLFITTFGLCIFGIYTNQINSFAIVSFNLSLISVAIFLMTICIICLIAGSYRWRHVHIISSLFLLYLPMQTLTTEMFIFLCQKFNLIYFLNHYSNQSIFEHCTYVGTVNSFLFDFLQIYYMYKDNYKIDIYGIKKKDNTIGRDDQKLSKLDETAIVDQYYSSSDQA
ncbi:unnamed protein product [Rotaria sp. Silwood2]|nr:unnamed protein product [Rotaria sp. Silwood2]